MADQGSATRSVPRVYGVYITDNCDGFMARSVEACVDYGDDFIEQTIEYWFQCIEDCVPSADCAAILNAASDGLHRVWRRDKSVDLGTQRMELTEMEDMSPEDYDWYLRYGMIAD